MSKSVNFPAISEPETGSQIEACIQSESHDDLVCAARPCLKLKMKKGLDMCKILGSVPVLQRKTTNQLIPNLAEDDSIIDAEDGRKVEGAVLVHPRESITK